MVNTSIAMKNVNPVLLGCSAVAAVDAVVRAVVPMAREHKQAFCGAFNQWSKDRRVFIHPSYVDTLFKRRQKKVIVNKHANKFKV